MSFRDEPVHAGRASASRSSRSAHGFWRVQVHYGFMETPDVPAALDACARRTASTINLFAVSYFLSREIIVPRRGAGMAYWRESLFAAMARNAGSVAEFFRLPATAWSSWGRGSCSSRRVFVR